MSDAQRETPQSLDPVVSDRDRLLLRLRELAVRHVEAASPFQMALCFDEVSRGLYLVLEAPGRDLDVIEVSADRALDALEHPALYVPASYCERPAVSAGA